MSPEKRIRVLLIQARPKSRSMDAKVAHNRRRVSRRWLKNRIANRTFSRFAATSLEWFAYWNSAKQIHSVEIHCLMMSKEKRNVLCHGFSARTLKDLLHSVRQ